MGSSPEICVTQKSTDKSVYEPRGRQPGVHLIKYPDCCIIMEAFPERVSDVRISAAEKTGSQGKRI